jgi:putative metallohydrolase (TIGR04338 family)
MGSRARDTQRQKLYDAENMVTSGPSPTATRLLVNGPKVPTTGSVSIEACQAYVNHVTGAAWFQSRWGRVTCEVRHKSSGHPTGGYGVMCLPPFGRTEPTILHELAHVMVPAGAAWHGPEFAAIYLTLVRYAIGKDACSALRSAFRAKRVRVASAAVPAPGSHAVVTRTAVVTERRAAAARQLEAHARGAL